jgi:hypothetical protein
MLVLVGCFEDPYSEHLHLWFTVEVPFVVTVVQEVAPDSAVRGNPELRNRLEQTRSEIDLRIDRWSRSFERVNTRAEHLSLESLSGETRVKVHTVVIDSFEEVQHLLEREGLSASLRRDHDSAELVIVPSGGSRATNAQRDHLGDLIDEWSVRISAYLESASRLYGHLDTRPDRALPCLAHVFDRHEGLGPTGPLDSEEEKLIVAVKRSMDRVTAALRPPSTEPYSLTELSRLVHDPFPARLSVAVDGDVLEIEGFIRNRRGNLERTTADAWSALESLEGRWLSPDLVSSVVSRGNDAPAEDPESFSLRPRFHFPPPSAEEVRSALESALIPTSIHRIRWRATKSLSPDSSNDNGTILRQAMTAAEAQVLSPQE